MSSIIQSFISNLDTCEASQVLVGILSKGDTGEATPAVLHSSDASSSAASDKHLPLDTQPARFEPEGAHTIAEDVGSLKIADGAHAVPRAPSSRMAAGKQNDENLRPEGDHAHSYQVS